MSETADTADEKREPALTGGARFLAVAGIVIGLVAVIGAAALVVTVALQEQGRGDEPVSVLLVGDSIMNQAGVYLEEALESRGEVTIDVEVHNHGENGSGLLTPEIHDWDAELPGLLERYEPDVVVALFVGNYTSTDLYVNQAGLEVIGYTDQFFDAWERAARRLHRTIAETGADVYWVNPPPLADEEGERRVDEFRRIHRALVENFTGTVMIDGTAALATGEGEFAWELPDEEGRLEQVRTLDSVHLTRHGAELLAEEIARQIAPSVVLIQKDLAT